MSTLHYDPYVWRLDELDSLHQNPENEHPEHEHDAAQARREELDAELVISEAEELAHGRRHLTIEYAPSDDVLDRDRLDDLADVIDVLTAPMLARRITRTDRYLTVTVAGLDATLAIAAIAEQVARLNPGHWHLTPSARPTRHQIAR